METPHPSPLEKLREDISYNAGQAHTSAEDLISHLDALAKFGSKEAGALATTMRKALGYRVETKRVSAIGGHDVYSLGLADRTVHFDAIESAERTLLDDVDLKEAREQAAGEREQRALTYAVGR